MVTVSQTSLRERARALPAFLGFILLGAVPLWLSLSSLLPSVHAIMRHAPLIALSPRDAIGLPLALLCFILAAMTLFPTPQLGPGRARKGRQSANSRRIDGLKLCLGLAIGCVLLTVVSVPLAEFAASTILTNQRYLPCPAPLHERHPSLRWTLSADRCP